MKIIDAREMQKKKSNIEKNKRPEATVKTSELIDFVVRLR